MRQEMMATHLGWHGGGSHEGEGRKDEDRERGPGLYNGEINQE